MTIYFVRYGTDQVHSFLLQLKLLLSNMALNIRKEVLELISLNEKIQSTLLMGGRLNEDEIQIVTNCAKELLDSSSKLTQKSDTKSNELSL